MRIIEFISYKINISNQFCNWVFANVLVKNEIYFLVRESQREGIGDGKGEGIGDGNEDGKQLKNLYFRANSKTIDATFFRCGTPVFYKSNFLKKS